MKYDCYIGFYDITKVQGFWGKVTQWITKSKITHVAPIIKIGNEYITITLLYGGDAKVSKIQAFEKLGVSLVDCCYVGAIDTNLERVFKDCDKYTRDSVCSVLLWYFGTRLLHNVGSYFKLPTSNHMYPKVCTTYTCDLFNLPITDPLTRVSPAQLYRSLKHDCDYVRWQSPSWKNNGC